MAQNNQANDPELASRYRVSDYRSDVITQNRERIADAMHRRFKERYLDSISRSGTHGFTRMAISCLMIEALTSFRRGWTKTPQGELAFCSFFNDHPQFADFRRHVADFYAGVRCGILHQAETTRGWRIRLDTRDLLDEASGVRTINARKFVGALGEALDRYRDELKNAPWDDELWTLFRKKMKSICRNCEP